MKTPTASTHRAVERLYLALPPASRERIARAYDLERAPASPAELSRELAARPWINPREILHEVLLPRELAPLARALGLSPEGNAATLRLRLVRSLALKGPRRFRAFPAARAFARSLKLTSAKEWIRWCAGELPDKPPRPEDIPTNPSKHYQDKGWAGWGDWLGTGAIASADRQMWSFTRARRFARSLGLRSSREWAPWCAGRLSKKPPRPPQVPSNPWKSYPDQWAGYRDWLGLPTVSERAERAPARRARAGR